MLNSFKATLKQLKITLKGDLVLPLILIMAYIIFLVIARGYIPTGEELVNTFSSLYAQFGYEIIFVAALLEALILVNIFAPGQLAMVMGIIFARTGETYLPYVILSVTAGASLGYMLSFLMGYFGFADLLERIGYADFVLESRKQLDKFGKRGLILGFFHSSIGSFFSFAAGTAKYNFITFSTVAILSTLFWTTLWSIPIYAFGDFFLNLIKKYSFLILLFMIVGLTLMRIWKTEESKTQQK